MATKNNTKTVELESKVAGAGSKERTIIDRGAVKENRSSDNGDTIEDDGVTLCTPTPQEDEANVLAVMDAFVNLFTYEVEREDQRTGEVTVSNSRNFAMRASLRSMIRQMDYDLDQLRQTIVKKENGLARLNRQINSDPRELERVEAGIEWFYDQLAERTHIRGVAVSYYPELTGEYYEKPASKQATARKEPEANAAAARQAARMKAAGLDS